MKGRELEWGRTPFFAIKKDDVGSDHPSFLDGVKRVILGPDRHKPEGERTFAKIRKIEPVKGDPTEDYEAILSWFSDPETRGHLDTFQDLPTDWNDPEQIRKAMFRLHEYYLNFGDDPKKITALAADDQKGEIMGVETIRWRGDPFIPRGSKIKIAGIERLIVDPGERSKGIGTRLVNEALRMAFVDRNYDEVRLWVYSDELAGDWNKNFEFFRELGFGIYGGPNKTWREYAIARGMGENEQNRDAIWMSIKRKTWESLEEDKEKLIQPKLFPPQNGQTVQ